MLRDRWEKDVSNFVLVHLDASPSRVLEIGCGEGWLTRAMVEAGYEARGIDPEAPGEELFERVTLENFTGTEPHDAIIAVLSLHHVGDAQAVLEKIKSLLNVRGRIIVVEFAWENLDEATLTWSLERLPSELDIEESWLQKRCLEWRARVQQGYDIKAQDYVREWARREHLRPGKEILGSLQEGFDQALFRWTPYLYSGLPDVTAEEEQAAIDRGEIRPVGFCFVGSKT
jgi:SAM-dependent methyltransferase